MNQLSPEWFAERCGRVTASRVADLMAKTKSGSAYSRANYMAQLIAERLTGQVAEGYASAAMQWGSEHEEQARAAYEFYTDQDIEQAGFVPHPTIDQFGASPDGLVGSDGLVEIKCPNTATHIETLIGRVIPTRYITQMSAQLSCTGRQWVDFISFDPRMPERLRMFKQRMYRSDEYILEIETEVKKFLEELYWKIEALESVNQACKEMATA